MSVDDDIVLGALCQARHLIALQGKDQAVLSVLFLAVSVRRSNESVILTNFAYHGLKAVFCRDKGVKGDRAPNYR